MKKTCFISGKITGLQDYAQKFKRAEYYVQRLGYIPVNPAEMTRQLVEYGVEWEDEQWLNICCETLLNCDAIFMLDNWEDSSGAKKEHAFAETNDILILYQTDFQVSLDGF